MKSEKIKAVLFDLDGVLINSLESWYSLYNETLAHFNKEKMSMDEFKRGCMHSSLEENMKKLGLGEKGAKYIRTNAVNFVDQIKIFPETLDVLKSINRKLGVVTNSPPKRTDKILDKFDLWNYFDVVVDAGDVENLKPAPDQIFVACNRLALNPEEVVFVADAQVDMEAGRAAGCKFIGIKINADIQINTLEELPDAIKEFDNND